MLVKQNGDLQRRRSLINNPRYLVRKTVVSLENILNRNFLPNNTVNIIIFNSDFQFIAFLKIYIALQPKGCVSALSYYLQ